MEAEVKNNTGLALVKLSFLDLSKEDIRAAAMNVVDGVQEGYDKAVDAVIYAQKLTEFAKLILENVKESAMDELKLATQEKRTIRGCEINQQMAGVKYDYLSTQDPVYKELSEKLKNREAFLKTIKGSKQELIEETGEVVEIFEPVKSGKMSLIVKIK